MIWFGLFHQEPHHCRLNQSSTVSISLGQVLLVGCIGGVAFCAICAGLCFFAICDAIFDLTASVDNIVFHVYPFQTTRVSTIFSSGTTDMNHILLRSIYTNERNPA